MAASRFQSRNRTRTSSTITEKSAGRIAAQAPVGGDATAVTTSLATVPGKLLTRMPAAKAIGVSVSTFRRRIENVELTPIVEDGVNRFREVEVLEVATRYRRERGDRGAELHDDLGKLTARVFELFDEAVHPADVVKRLEKPAAVIEEIHSQWARMRGTFVVNGDEIEKIRACVFRTDPGPRSDVTRGLIPS